MIGLSLGTPAGSLQGAELPEVLTPLPPQPRRQPPRPQALSSPPLGLLRDGPCRPHMAWPVPP